MKVCLIQPPYSMDFTQIDNCFEEELKILDACPTDVDIIVLPEYSDVLSATPSGEDFIKSLEK